MTIAALAADRKDGARFRNATLGVRNVGGRSSQLRLEFTSHKRRDKMSKKIIDRASVAPVLACMLISIVLLVPAKPPLSKENDHSGADAALELEEAVLAERWGSVVDLLASVTAEDTSTVARLLKGHACLALNRNNESICLLLGGMRGDTTKQWRKWTDRFMKNHLGSAIAYYLVGDSYARLGQTDSALMAFDKGLTRNPKHPMILNAKGVAQASRGEWDAALATLTRATMVESTLADAHASLGMLWIQRRNGASGALDAFNDALRISADFALARNGRGCAYFALGKWKEAEADFLEDTTAAGCLPIPLWNAYVLAHAELDCIEQAADSVAGSDPQMPVWRQQFGIKTQILGAQFANVGNVFLQTLTGSVNTLNPSLSFSLNQSRTGLQQSLTAGCNPNWQALHGQTVNLTNQNMIHNFSKINGLQTQLAGPSGKGGGVLIDMRKMYADKGNWLSTWAGLGYHVAPAESSTAKGEKSQ